MRLPARIRRWLDVPSCGDVTRLAASGASEREAIRADHAEKLDALRAAIERLDHRSRTLEQKHGAALELVTTLEAQVQGLLARESAREAPGPTLPAGDEMAEVMATITRRSNGDRTLLRHLHDVAASRLAGLTPGAPGYRDAVAEVIDEIEQGSDVDDLLATY